MNQIDETEYYNNLSNKSEQEVDIGPSDEDVDKLKEELENQLLELLVEQEQDIQFNKINYMYPNEGEYRRELYPKFVEHFAAGAIYKQRAIIAANRSGKTTAALYELALHMTGLYPKWWTGRKFLNPVSCWAASITNQMTREVIQDGLLGPFLEIGTGMIPKHLIVNFTRKTGAADTVETLYVRHVSGRLSSVVLKSYDQKRIAFQGTYKHVILLDEEPADAGIYTECLTRTINKANPGMVITTFTPLLGLSEIVMSFLPGGRRPANGIVPGNGGKYVTSIEWDDVPHLDDEQKAELLASYAPHERAARSKGIPSLGAGAIYPYPEDEIFVAPKEIQPWWPRAYGLDVGWNRTAAVWAAYDAQSKIYYVYSEHYVSETLPALHASAIKARGDWIAGAIDPGSTGGSQRDGVALFDEYEAEGLLIQLADNTIEAGILRVGQLFASGRLKIFNSCTNLLEEFRIYRRDEKGQIVKKKDHALDALRYCMMSFDELAVVEPDPDYRPYKEDYQGGRDPVTGY